jgi:hypothetical protein
MATTSLKVTYDELRQGLASYFGASRTIANWHADVTADVNLLIRAALRSIYSAHQWSFLRTDYTQVTSVPYATGTITVIADVAGSQATLAGGTWPTWAAYGWIYINGVGYEVLSRTSGSILVLDDPGLAFSALTTYELRRFAYIMPADFAGFDTPLAYAPGESVNEYVLEKVGIHEIRKAYRSMDSLGTCEPQKYAQFLYSNTPTSAGGGELRAIAIWPPSDAAYHLTAERYILPNDLDATSIYPAGGALYGEMFLAAVHAQYELKKMRMMGGPMQQAFQAELIKAIESDKLLASPDTLGPFVGGQDDGDRPINPSYPNNYVEWDAYDIFQ